MTLNAEVINRLSFESRSCKSCQRLQAEKTRYFVQIIESVYKFRVVEDLGHDSQGGHFFDVIAHCTYRPTADALAKSLNREGVLYIPGKLYGD